MDRLINPLPVLGLLVALLTGLSGKALAQDAQDQANLPLRVVAANISSGRHQTYPLPGPGTRILQALEPDVVLIQEWNVERPTSGSNTNADLDAWVEAVFGPEFFWCREPGGEHIPNGVISRFPFLDLPAPKVCNEWHDGVVPDRDFAFARIDLPGEKELWAVSLHLKSKQSTKRQTQAVELVARMQDQITPNDYLLVGGDLNTNNRFEAAIGTLSQTLETPGPHPDDGGPSPKGGTNSSRKKPYDWILADLDLDIFEVPTVIGSRSFPNGLVFDTRLYTQAELDSDFPPAQEGDSAAEQMQHMAVVRDFLLPLPPMNPDPELPTTYGLSSRAVDFGTIDADAGPVEDRSVVIRVTGRLTLTCGCAVGGHAEEFEVVTPGLGEEIAGDRELVIRWTPAANDGAEREVTITFGTDAGPFDLRLRGATLPPDEGGSTPPPSSF